MIAVSFDITALEKSLDDAIKTIERKMVGMVHKFAYVFAATALDNTPYGDVLANAGYYNLKSRLKYLPAEAGYAKGGWMIEMQTPSGDMFPDKADSREATNVHDRLKQEVTAYKLGETIYIANNVPYVSQEGWTLPSSGALDKGYSKQAPYGIRQPTMGSVLRTYQLHLDDYYHKS